MARCLIGCGSNLGRRRDLLDRAMELLGCMPGVSVRAVSHYRETVPVGGPPGQPAFLNAACLIDTDLPPAGVLEILAAVERTLQRERTERWAARTIDLDLLLYDDVVLDTPDLTIPHPRMATRRFVLEPAAEIAGEIAFPPTGCTVRDLLDNISAPHPLVVVIGVPGSGASEIASAVADAVMGRPLHAPMPLPMADGGPRAALARWQATLTAWAEPLARDRWTDAGTVTVADYWCDGLVAAAADELDADELEDLRVAADAIAARSVAPRVAIMLVADPAALEERIAFRARRSRDHTDVFADLAATALVCDRPGDRVAPLLQLQDRLLRRLRAAFGRAPKAVLTIDASDLSRAALESMAAVEAML
jgi:2-amino-4-hydroxy-6-hydroxymethyldihydropteridine diphosphokinase